MTLTKVASLLLIITAVFALLILGKSLLIPFVIAVLIWYLINALSHFIGKFKIGSKSIPYWLATIISAVIISLILFFIGSMIAQNAQQMIEQLPNYEKNVGSIAGKIGKA